MKIAQKNHLVETEANQKKYNHKVPPQKRIVDMFVLYFIFSQTKKMQKNYQQLTVERFSLIFSIFNRFVFLRFLFLFELTQKKGTKNT